MYPIDDFSRYHRPAAAIAASMGSKASTVLDWLQPDPRNAGLTDADRRTMAAFGYRARPH